jgi:hypothetical protein
MSRACVRLFTRLARPRASPFEAESATALSVPACARARVCVHADNSLGVSAFVLKYRVPARPQLAGLPKWCAHRCKTGSLCLATRLTAIPTLRLTDIYVRNHHNFSTNLRFDSSGR